MRVLSHCGTHGLAQSALRFLSNHILSLNSAKVAIQVPSLINTTCVFVFMLLYHRCNSCTWFEAFSSGTQG